MLKNSFFLATLAACGLLMSSCSQDDFAAPESDGTVTFNVKLPGEVNSRADDESKFADGTKATQLHYAVYISGSDTPVFTSKTATDPQAVKLEEKYFTLGLKLIKGHTYDMIFWAQSPDADCYEFDPINHSISIKYENVKINDETRDAFFGVLKELTVSGSVMPVDVSLYRPFAQLNVATNDYNDAKIGGITEIKTAVTVKDVYTKLDLLTGIASEPEEVAFSADVPAEEKFLLPPVSEKNTYTYMAMNYVLTGTQLLETAAEDVNQAQKETKDISITFTDQTGVTIKELSLSAVPFQRNYKTNIYGQLFTSTVQIGMNIMANFNNPDYENIYTAKTADDIQTAIDHGAKEIIFANDIEVPAGQSFTVPALSPLQRINLDGHKLTFKAAEEESANNAPAIYFDRVYHNIGGTNKFYCYIMGATGAENAQNGKHGTIVFERNGTLLDNLQSCLFMQFIDIECTSENNSSAPVMIYGGNTVLYGVNLITKTSSSINIVGNKSTRFAATNCTVRQTGEDSTSYLFDMAYDSEFANIHKSKDTGEVTLRNCKMSSYTGVVNIDFASNVATEAPAVTITGCQFGSFAKDGATTTANVSQMLKTGTVKIDGTSIFYSANENAVFSNPETNIKITAGALFSHVPTLMNGENLVDLTSWFDNNTSTISLINPEGVETEVTVAKKRI